MSKTTLAEDITASLVEFREAVESGCSGSDGTAAARSGRGERADVKLHWIVTCLTTAACNASRAMTFGDDKDYLTEALNDIRAAAAWIVAYQDNRASGAAAVGTADADAT